MVTKYPYKSKINKSGDWAQYKYNIKHKTGGIQ